MRIVPALLFPAGLLALFTSLVLSAVLLLLAAAIDWALDRAGRAS